MRIREKIQPYLKFTHGERKGLVVLVSILTLALLTKEYLHKLIPGKDLPEFEYVEVPNRVNEERQTKYLAKAPYYPKEKLNRHTIKPQPFDPNTASLELLLKIGFSQKAARSIVGYRNKGGVFYNKSSLYRMYGVDSTQSTGLIEEFCNIDTLQLWEKKKRRKGFEKLFVIEVNTADTLMLDKLPGIGKILSGRIIRYREKLGGFVQEEQLKEVYGINSALFDKLSGKIKIDTQNIRKLTLNKSPLSELKNHPYISTYQAKAIIKYRELIGDFKSLQELEKNYILSKSEYQLVMPYLKLD